MVEVTPDKQLLTYLKQFGIGNHKQIANLLREIFPVPDNEESFKIYRKDIADFLVALKKHDFITLNEFNFNYEGESSVKAAILAKGIEYLQSDSNTPSLPHIHVEGSGNQIISHSPSASSSDDHSHKASAIKKSPTTISAILNNWKLVISIILGLIAVWTGIQSFNKSDSEKGLNDSTILKNVVDTTKKDSQQTPQKHVIWNEKGKPNRSQKEVALIDSSSKSIEFPILSKSSKNNNLSGGFLDKFKIISSKSTIPVPRYVEQSDIDEILKFIPNPPLQILINYQREDEEAKHFAFSLKDKLEDKQLKVTVADLSLIASTNNMLGVYKIKFEIDNTDDSVTKILIPPLNAK